jgi:hypothetical protein
MPPALRSPLHALSLSLYKSINYQKKDMYTLQKVINTCINVIYTLHLHC